MSEHENPVDVELERISQSCSNARDQFKLGVARQVLHPFFHEYVSQSRGGGRDDRISVRELERPDLAEALSKANDVDDLIQITKEYSAKSAQIDAALALSTDLLKLPNGECRFVMYPDLGQICYEHNQEINNAVLGRCVAAAIEGGRGDLVSLAKTRAGVAIIASGKPTEQGNRPNNDHLHVKGRYFALGSLQEQLQPLTEENVAQFKEAQIIGADYLQATAIQGDQRAR